MTLAKNLKQNKNSRPRTRPGKRRKGYTMTIITQDNPKHKYTLEDIKAMDREMLTPAIVSQVVGCDPHYIRIQARADPEALGFPVSVQGSRTRIPRRAFIKWMEVGLRDSYTHHAKEEIDRTQCDPFAIYAG